MSPVTRRRFLAGGATLAATASLPALFMARRRQPVAANLDPDPRRVIDLPPGFEYRILQRRGDLMSDGYRVPGRPDGMACFPGRRGQVVLMRNHENRRGLDRWSPYLPHTRPPREAYDRYSIGGVTRVVVDLRAGSIPESNLVLTGTERNCAGGPSPWGWLSCEESVLRKHGYVFLCDVQARRVQPPRRIVGYGRFNHEAVAIDPRTNHAFLTEDRGDGALYRFVPHRKESPFEGRLQALRVMGQPRVDLGEGMQVGDRFRVEWVDLDEPEPREDTLRFEAADKGAAKFRRGEGIFYADGSVWICATAGGPVACGQIFKLTPAKSKGASHDLIELIAQSHDADVLDMPDNIVVNRWGDVYMAEDGGGDQFLRMLRPDGSIHTFARNASSVGEFAGVCFTPDGQTLFVNLQIEGMTLAITGPFERFGRNRAG